MEILVNFKQCDCGLFMFFEYFCIRIKKNAVL